MKISVSSWRKLPAEEQEKFEYISNAEGCFFQEKEQGSSDGGENKKDDFERLYGKEE